MVLLEEASVRFKEVNKHIKSVHVAVVEQQALNGRF